GPVNPNGGSTAVAKGTSGSGVEPGGSGELSTGRSSKPGLTPGGVSAAVGADGCGSASASQATPSQAAARHAQRRSLETDDMGRFPHRVATTPLGAGDFWEEATPRAEQAPSRECPHALNIGCGKQRS